jgi:hypothetical protein
MSLKTPQAKGSSALRNSGFKQDVKMFSSYSGISANSSIKKHPKHSVTTSKEDALNNFGSKPFKSNSLADLITLKEAQK